MSHKAPPGPCKRSSNSDENIPLASTGEALGLTVGDLVLVAPMMEAARGFGESAILGYGYEVNRRKRP